MAESCCLWSAEYWDDSLKSMFQSDEALANGNRAKALAYLDAQVRTRMPIIKSKAEQLCGRRLDSRSKMLAQDLTAVADDIRHGKPYKDVHRHVMAVDKRHAANGYRAFAQCLKR